MQNILSQWNWIDVAALICLLRFGYVGATQGIGGELARVVGLLSGILVGFRWYQPAGDWLAARTLLTHEWAAALALVLMVVAGYAVVSLLIRLAGKAVSLKFAPALDKTGGVAFGVIRAMLVVSVVLVTLQQLPSDAVRASIDERSWSGRYLARVAPSVYDAVGPWVARVVPASLVPKVGS